MHQYIAHFKGFMPKTRRVYPVLEDDYLEVVPGEFKQVEQDYEFTAKNDSNAISHARKQLKRFLPSGDGMKLTGLSKLVDVPLGDKK